MKLRGLTVFVLLQILLLLVNCFAQEKVDKNNQKVKLLNWSSEDCDNTYDPYLLKNRISHLETLDGITSITVNFSDNCCIKFAPKIEFKNNRLTLIPYGDLEDLCSCNCCFSLKFEISGLEGLKYKVYFKDKQVQPSDDHYELKKASAEVYQGRTINRINKYGFKEGIWISFYQAGKQKRVSQYPESSLYNDPEPMWSKEYYRSGKLLEYKRGDTTETWFEDGELKSQDLKYKLLDTTITKSFRKYDSRTVAETYLEKFYPTIFKSDFDPDFKSSGYLTEILYKEEYYENGQLKYLFGRDTSYTWYENGKVNLKNYKNGSLEFDEHGQLLVRSYHWKVPGSKGMGDLENSIYVKFYRDGNIEEVYYVRDEPEEDNYINPKVRYVWQWDQNRQPITGPEGWKEGFPWEKFSELKP